MIVFLAAFFVALSLVILAVWLATGFNMTEWGVLCFALMLIYQYGMYEATTREEQKTITLAQFFKQEVVGVSVAVVVANLAVVPLCVFGLYPWSVFYGIAIVPMGLASYYCGRFFGILPPPIIERS